MLLSRRSGFCCRQGESRVTIISNSPVQGLGVGVGVGPVVGEGEGVGAAVGVGVGPCVGSGVGVAEGADVGVGEARTIVSVSNSTTRLKAELVPVIAATTMMSDRISNIYRFNVLLLPLRIPDYHTTSSLVIVRQMTQLKDKNELYFEFVI